MSRQAFVLIIFILQMRKPRLRKSKQIAQGHSTRQSEAGTQAPAVALWLWHWITIPTLDTALHTTERQNQNLNNFHRLGKWVKLHKMQSSR